MRQVLVLTAGVVVVYLLVANATGAGRLLGTAFQGYSGAVRTLQGR